jgi:ABC-2 type transport system permease protein
MNKTLRVALHEYRQHVFNRRFLLGLMSVPLVAVVMVGLIFLIISMENNTTPIGYVDHAGFLSDPSTGSGQAPVPAPTPEPPDKPVPMVAYANEADAEIALSAGEIQAYYIIPEDYLSTGKLDVVYYAEVKSPARIQFYDFLTANLLRDTDPAVANRLVKGSEVTVQSTDGKRSISTGDWFSVIFPMIIALAFIIAMFSTGGYLMQAVVDEKENRTMEVIITSVSPNQFMAGKIIGDIAVGLTQILVWALFLAIGVIAGRESLDFLRGVQISSQTILLVVVIIFPSFIIVAALMATVGATVTEAREGQQVIGLISLPIWIPYIFMFTLMNNPNSPIAIVLSMIPLTAPLTILVRDGVTVLPAWQIALSSAIQFLAAVGAIWLAGRAFRLGMLRYGKRLKWREIFARQGAKA